MEFLHLPPQYKQNKEFETALSSVAHDLRDVVLKWGTRFLDDDDLAVVCSEDFGVENKFTIIADIRDGKQTVFVKSGTKRDTSIAIGNESEFRIVDLPGGQFASTLPSGLVVVRNYEEGSIIWDGSIKPQEIKDGIKKIDAKAKENGLLTANGQRIPISEFLYIQKPRLRADEAFDDPEIIMPVVPGYPVEALRDNFDDPENLIVITDPYSGEPRGVTHKKFEVYHQLKDDVIQEILLKRDLTIPELIEGIDYDPETFMPLALSIRDELHPETEKRWQEYLESQDKTA